MKRFANHQRPPQSGKADDAQLNQLAPGSIRIGSAKQSRFLDVLDVRLNARPGSAFRPNMKPC
ncbi:hypothetical protein FYK55_27750 [Roseiconus nitratireducens]|uniref:Uncharacterized protein n=1 Tax=Roseiconus nitratireducens TaxID=2605748 RepID=A0A5M6CYQ3_9BACT|nr:hypothetical protein [Roseiconus nitratireducens]KAA5538015.1 hypothetical protein FYK55_27750 [Roseiconus nitratireducens]